MRSTPSSGAAADRGGWTLWAAGAAILVALLAFAALDPGDGTKRFFLLLGIASGAYLAAMRSIGSGVRPSRRALIAFVALAAAWRVPLALLPPEPGTDLRRYLWDARLVRSGLNPYSVVPADPDVAHLRTAENWPVNNPDVPSPYPPTAQVFFFAATAVRESPLAIKTALLVCDALLALALWRWLSTLDANPAWVLAYLWNPLVSLEVARPGHVDVVGAACLIWAVLALCRGRTLPGTAAFAVALAVKPLPIVLAPLLWRRIAWRDAAVGLGLLVLLYLPFWDRGLPVGSVPDVVRRFRFNGPVFETVAAAAGAPAAVAFAIAAGVALATWARARLPIGSFAAWAWPMAATLLCSPLVYPWYLTWLAPFLVVPSTVPLAIWTVCILSTYVVWERASAGAPWAVPWWALLLEYGVLAVATAWTFRRRSKAATSPTAP